MSKSAAQLLYAPVLVNKHIDYFFKNSSLYPILHHKNMILGPLRLFNFRKIERGDEITINYRGTLDNPTRNHRRSEMARIYNFICCCEGCDLTTEQLEIQNELCAQYMKLMKEKDAKKDHGGIPNELASCLDDLKTLYKIAKSLKLFRRGVILKNIVEDGFNTACISFIGSAHLNHRTTDVLLEKREKYFKDIVNFAIAGWKISTDAYGPDHPETEQWKQRKDQPLDYFQMANKPPE